MGLLKDNQYYSINNILIDKKNNTVQFYLDKFDKKNGTHISSSTYSFKINDEYELDENKKIKVDKDGKYIVKNSVFNELFISDNQKNDCKNIFKSCYKLLKQNDKIFEGLKEV